MDVLSEKIIALCDQSGKSDMELERILCLPRSTIYNWRNGRSKSYNKYLNCIAQYFNVSVDSLLGNGNKKIFGERLRDIRISSGLTIKELANEAGVVPSVILELEQGEKEPRIAIVENIADALQVTPEYLTGWLPAHTAMNSVDDNTLEERVPPTDEDIKFALFEGSDDITDEMYEDVKAYARFVKERKKKAGK